MLDFVNYLVNHPVAGASFALLILTLTVVVSGSKYNRWPSLPERIETRWTKHVLLQLVHASTNVISAIALAVTLPVMYFTGSYWSLTIWSAGLFVGSRCVQEGVKIPGLLDLIHWLLERAEIKRLHTYRWRCVRKESI